MSSSDEVPPTDSGEVLLPSLPYDVITEILTRLPVKSLCKFRCVSKPWNSLLHSHRFTKMHLSKALRNLSQQSVLLSVNPFVSIKYDDVDGLVKQHGLDRSLVTWKEAHPVIAGAGTNKEFYVVGECHGFVCMEVTKNRTDRNIYLWNPSIGICRELLNNDDTVNASIVGDKRCMFSNKPGDTIRFDVYVFGYDSIVDDYKIVRLVLYKSCSDVFDVEIYSVGSKTLRKIQVQISVLAGCFKPCCFVVNGSCHWIASRAPWKMAKKMAILSFNLEREKLEEQVVPLPEWSKLDDYFSMDTTVVNGLLCLTLMSLSGFTDLWVMNRDGDRSLWTKKAKLGGLLPVPICFTRKGDILVCENDFLRMVDPKTNAQRGGVTSCGLLFCSQPIMFTESLVSPYHIPNADDENLL